MVDAEGQPLQLERALLLLEAAKGKEAAADAKPVARLSGVVHPLDGALAKEAGRRVQEPWGPVTGWSVAYTKQGWVVSVQVAGGARTYDLVKPSSAYRKVHALLDEQLAICHQVRRTAT